MCFDIITLGGNTIFMNRVTQNRTNTYPPVIANTSTPDKCIPYNFYWILFCAYVLLMIFCIYFVIKLGDQTVLYIHDACGEQILRDSNAQKHNLKYFLKKIKVCQGKKDPYWRRPQLQAGSDFNSTTKEH